MRSLGSSWRIHAPGALAAAALLASLGFWLYVALGSPAPARQEAAPSSEQGDQSRPAHDPNELALGARQLVRQLERQPDDPNGWQLLARTYVSLGQDQAALDTLQRATELLPRDLDLLLAYADAQLSRIEGDRLPAVFVETMERINAIDPDQPDSLWYLGIAAADGGDGARARSLWERLLARLPADHPARAALQARLLKLP
jgi:cytochrome c-type biogenesis protein CcmH